MYQIHIELSWEPRANSRLLIFSYEVSFRSAIAALKVVPPVNTMVQGNSFSMMARSVPVCRQPWGEGTGGPGRQKGEPALVMAVRPDSTAKLGHPVKD